MSGPYMNESGDWWVPVEGASFRAARAEIVKCLDFTIPEGGRLVYRGKMMARLTDHEYGCDCGCATERLAFHFTENRRW